jgi:hypothetical protein
MFWPNERTAEILGWWRDFIVDAPLELNGFFAVMTVPPVPPFPPSLHNTKVCAVVWCWCGPAARATEVLAPVRTLDPILDGVQQMPFPMLQQAFDALYPPGLQWYWKADFFSEIPDAALAEHARFGTQLPTMQSTMHIYPMDGAVHRVGPTETAFSFREASFNQVIVGVDPSPNNRKLLVDWARAYYRATHPYSSGGAYVNFLQGDEDDRVRGTYRDNLPRLLEIKRRYDPDNLFRINHNIDPTAAQPAASHP